MYGDFYKCGYQYQQSGVGASAGYFMCGSRSFLHGSHEGLSVSSV